MSGFWQAVLYVHLLAMAFFVGGQIVFGIAVVPVIATGWALASHLGLGLAT